MLAKEAHTCPGLVPIRETAAITIKAHNTTRFIGTFSLTD
jgi:hypothetical protein